MSNHPQPVSAPSAHTPTPRTDKLSRSIGLIYKQGDRIELLIEHSKQLEAELVRAVNAFEPMRLALANPPERE